MNIRPRARAPIPTAAITLLLTGVVSPVLAQSPAVDDIVRQAVARAEAQVEREAQLGYESTYVMHQESLDGDGNVKEVEKRTYRQYPVEGVLYDELVAKEGEPLDEDDARDEAKRKREFIEEVRKRREKGEPPDPRDENRVEFNEEFVSRYDITLVDEERVNGHACWVLALEPRDGDLPVRRRIDHALNNASGTIWITQDDFGVARVEFEMARSVRFWGGIVGTLRNTVGHLEFDRIDDGVWLPTNITIRLDLRIFFRNIRRRIIMGWQEYLPQL